MSPFELALQGLPIRQPSAGYVDRVLGQRPRPAATVRPPLLGFWTLRVAAALALGVCLAAVAYWLGTRPGGPRPEVARAPEAAVVPERPEAADDEKERLVDLAYEAAAGPAESISEQLDGAPSGEGGPTLLTDGVRGAAERGEGGMGATDFDMEAPARGGRGAGRGGRGGGGMSAGGPPVPGRGGVTRDIMDAEFGAYDDAAMGASPGGARGSPAPGNRDPTFAEGLSVRRALVRGQPTELLPNPPSRSGWGYVDYTGQWVIPPQFQIAGDFASGIAQVQDRYDQPAYYIDFNGKRVDDVLVARIRGGLVRVQKNGKWGFLDPRTGEMAVEAKYDQAWDFSEGLACVMLSESGPSYRWIDYAGREVIALPEARNAGSFHEGRAAVEVEAGGSGADPGAIKCGFIDRSGKFAVEPKFDQVFNFSEGRALVRVGRKYGYIDLAGKLVIPAKFDGGMAFSEGLAGVRITPENRDRVIATEMPNADGWGFINTAGEFVFPPQYMRVTPFSHGVAFVYFSDRQGGEAFGGFIDHSGNRVLDLTRTERYPPEE